MIKDTRGQDVALTSNTNIKRNVIIISLLLLVIVFAASALMSSPTASRSIDKVSVQIATVETGDLIRDIVANGRVVAASAPQVYSPEQGFATLQVKAGEKVTVGQTVAIVESPELDNQLEQQLSEMDRLKGELAREELDSRSQSLQLTKILDLAHVDLEAAQRENRRAQIAMKSHLISQIDFEKAVDELAKAELNQKHAREDVDIAKDRLAYELESARNRVSRQGLILAELERKILQLNIVASVNGVVGNLLVQPRSVVNKNDPLMTLVDLSAYEVELSVAESYANDLAIGMPTEITIAGETVMGTLSAISPEVKDRQVSTRVQFDQQSVASIRQNQQVSARVLLENKTQIVKVRRGSFLQAGGFVAYKLIDNVAHKVEIQVGATSMREVEILSGLNPHDEIIISNYEAFIDTPSILLN